MTHESAGLLPACLESLRTHAGALDLAIVVADSGSTDAVESVCRGRAVTFLAGPNEGFGAAANRALAHDVVRRARYVLVMNPDVEIADGTLTDFVALCDLRAACAVFAPRQVDQHGRLVFSIGRAPSPADSWGAARTLDADWVRKPGVYKGEARCDWVMGAFMVIRRDVLAALGGFDERFFLFSEEVDLCTRVRRAGWEVGYLPQLTIAHRVADRPLDEHRERLIMWSQVLYMRKWYGLPQRASMRAALVARLARLFVRRLRAGDRLRYPWVRLEAALWFRRRQYGPAPRPAATPAERP